jgi:O-antigen ligase
MPDSAISTTSHSRNLDRVAIILLCIAGIAFPFSVAATNIALGASLVFGLISGQLWQGLKSLWLRQRLLSLAFLAYFTLLILGLVWSHDRSWGMHILGVQWFWLLTPLLICVLQSDRNREWFLTALSIGLILHLAFCIAQIFGYVEVTVAGSSAKDATGHIGHIGFGFVYAIWAGWLSHIGWLNSGWKRWAAWTVAIWAFVMIFAALGRSGYLIALVILLVLAWKYFLSGQGWKRIVLTILLAFIVVGTAITTGPAQARLKGTWNGIQAVIQGNFRGVEARWIIWLGAVEIWKSYPVLGVGTGGYPQAAMQVTQEKKELKLSFDSFGHPHNIYLLALVRWGWLGVVCLIFLLCVWIRTGWRLDWQHTYSGYFVTVPGIALAIHGFTSSSLEEHFSGILAALFLGTGLAIALKEQREQDY